MVHIEQARKLLGDQFASLSDEDIQEIIDSLYIIADTVIETLWKNE